MNLPDLIDIEAPTVLEIQVSHDRRRVWVNINGKCVLRCCQIENLIVEDIDGTTRTCDKCGLPFEVVVRRRITTCPACDETPAKTCPKHQVEYETAQCPMCAAGMD